MQQRTPLTRSRLLDQLLIRAIQAGALNIRDVDAPDGQGEEPFLYSSGNRGPVFLSVKGLVSQTAIRDALCAHLAVLIADSNPNIDFVAANVTGGVPFGVLLHQNLTRLYGRDVPMVYIRGSRKRGGQQELVTGLSDNHRIIKRGAHCLVVEELVNYATTTTNSAMLMRELGFIVDEAACIASYDHAACRALLTETGVALRYLVTIAQMLDLAADHNLFTDRKMQGAREFLDDPTTWMSKRGFVRDEKGGT